MESFVECIGKDDEGRKQKVSSKQHRSSNIKSHLQPTYTLKDKTMLVRYFF